MNPAFNIFARNPRARFRLFVFDKRNDPTASNAGRAVRPQNLTVLQGIEGFILHKNPAFGGAGAQGLSQRTVSSYKDILEHWAARIGGEAQVPRITSQDLKRYLVWKTTEYVPIRKNGKTHPLSPKTTRNIYVTFQAFFRWIGEEFDPRDLGSEERSRGKFPSPMKGIPVPRFVSPPIDPFTKDEVVSLIKACVQKRESRPTNRRAFTTCRPYTLRDQTVIKFLLDTGLRASEFTSLRIGDVDLVTGRVMIRTGKEGGAKGGHPIKTMGQVGGSSLSAMRSAVRFGSTSRTGRTPATRGPLYSEPTALLTEGILILNIMLIWLPSPRGVRRFPYRLGTCAVTKRGQALLLRAYRLIASGHSFWKSHVYPVV